MKIRPLADKVIVQRLEAESVTSGGIVLPDAAREKPQRGKVVSVGKGKMLEDGSLSKMQVKRATLYCLRAMPVRKLRLTAKSI